MRVAVLGGGIVGLLAAKGARDAGADVIVYAKGPGELPSGVFYLHDPCGLPLKEEVVYNFLNGTADGYAIKAYGAPMITSADRLRGSEPCYDAQAAMSLLRRLDLVVEPREITSLGDALGTRADLVVSSIPRYILFPGLLYPSVTTWGIATQKGEFMDHRPSSLAGMDLNFCLYFGGWETSLLRLSYVFGRLSAEAIQIMPGFVPIRKVLDFSGPEKVDDRFLLVGRYGAWKKGYLAHQAYYDTRKRVKAMMEAR